MAQTPPFTSSLDAAIPAENIILSHHIAETGKWVAVSQASDDNLFTGYAATEALARRAAGLRTLAYLQARAKGEVVGLSAKQIAAAKAELSKVLGELLDAVSGHNGTFPSSCGREIVEVHVRSAKEMVDKAAGKGVLAKWVLPSLVFLSGAFGSGVIGVYAERAVQLVEDILAG